MAFTHRVTGVDSHSHEHVSEARECDREYTEAMRAIADDLASERAVERFYEEGTHGPLGD